MPVLPAMVKPSICARFRRAVGRRPASMIVVSVAAVSALIVRRTTFGSHGDAHARRDRPRARTRGSINSPPLATAADGRHHLQRRHRRPGSPSTPRPARCRSSFVGAPHDAGAFGGKIGRRRRAEAVVGDVTAEPLGADAEPDLDRADVARLDDDVGERQHAVVAVARPR